MRKLLMMAAILACVPFHVNAQAVTKGDVQRLDLDQITLDGTTVTATGAELNILDGVTATAAELNYNDITTLGTAAASKAMTLDASGDLNANVMAFNTNIYANPLTRSSWTSATQASINAGAVTLLSGVAGVSIYPTGSVTVQASGTASGATSVSIKCSGGNILTTFPISLLVNDVPVGSFVSYGISTDGVGLTEGCAAGESVQASVTGVLGTTSHLIVTFPYVTQ